MSVTFASGALPSGMAPDDNLGPLVLRTLWTLLAISTVIVSARIVVKCKTTRRIYWDDLLMVLALVRRIPQWLLESSMLTPRLGLWLCTCCHHICGCQHRVRSSYDLPQSERARRHAPSGLLFFSLGVSLSSCWSIGLYGLSFVRSRH